MTRWRRAVVRWLRRYAPAEVAATAGALLGALLGARIGGAVGGAVGGDLGEGLAFYAVVVVRELRAERGVAGPRPLRRMLLDLLTEFGPAEAVDSFALRPLAMYAGPFVTGDLLTGTIAGKVAADLVFYAIAAFSYEQRRARRVAVDPLAPEVLDAARHRTPFLVMDLDRVVDAYEVLHATLPVDEIHYATTCNADPGVLAALHRAGCRFTVASYPELVALRRIGVRPADVLFGNPVKPPDHVARAHAAGCWRFAADSPAELDKLAAHAPGSAVYLRLHTGTTSDGPHDSRFGVGLADAADLLLDTARRGLRPYGVTFHVGARTTQPEAWAEAIDRVGMLASWLAKRGLHLSMLDIGGGFPARHADGVPALAAYAKQIGAALDRLPYRPRIVAEPGRAVVAEAGVLVATVLGHARRRERDWVHLDVGASTRMADAFATGHRPVHHPLSDSRRGVPGRFHVTGPSGDSRDTILVDAPLSADVACGDRVYIGGAGAYPTARSSRVTGFDVPAVRCVGPRDDRAVRRPAVPVAVSPCGS